LKAPTGKAVTVKNRKTGNGVIFKQPFLNGNDWVGDSTWRKIIANKKAGSEDPAEFDGSAKKAKPPEGNTRER
jgi:hypothetical protein